MLENISPYLAWFMVTASVVFLYYYGVRPLLEIIKMSQFDMPVNNKDEIPQLRAKRIESFKENPFLQARVDNLAQLKNTSEDYERITEILSLESNAIRKKYITDIFYKTAVSQNGFIDGMMLLGASFYMIKEIFTLYNGRVNNYALWGIVKKVYYAVIISGMDSVEAATSELFDKITYGTLSKIPFANVIFTSVIDGFVSAVMLTRIAIITENYCKELYIESEKDILPKNKYVTETTKAITGDVLSIIKENIKKFSKEKIIGNPLSRIYDNKVIEKVNGFWGNGRTKVGMFFRTKFN